MSTAPVLATKLLTGLVAWNAAVLCWPSSYGQIYEPEIMLRCLLYAYWPQRSDAIIWLSY